MRSESTALFSAEDLDLARQAFGQARERFVAWRRRRLGLRGALLFLAGLPLLLAVPLALAAGNLTAAFVNAAAFGVVMLAARLNRRGLLERALAPERRYTSPVRLPHQLLALLLVVIAVFAITHLAIGRTPAVGATYSLFAAAGFYLAYGPLSLRFRRSDPRVRVEDPAMRRALEQAERQLLSIESAALDIGNAELGQRLRRIADRGRTVLAMLAQRPNELFRAKRFLAVHLDGAERVAVQYAKSHRLVRSGELEGPFRAVLTQIEAAVDRQRRQLLNQDKLDLDVQIAVLRRQLLREGFD